MKPETGSKRCLWCRRLIERSKARYKLSLREFERTKFCSLACFGKAKAGRSRAQFRALLNHALNGKNPTLMNDQTRASRAPRRFDTDQMISYCQWCRKFIDSADGAALVIYGTGNSLDFLRLYHKECDEVRLAGKLTR